MASDIQDEYIEAAQKLLNADKTNPCRLAFGVGHSIVYLGLSFLPAAGTISLSFGQMNGLLADINLYTGVSSMMAVFAIYSRCGEFDKYLDPWKKKLPAINVEFAMYVAGQCNNPRYPVLKSFAGGLLNGLKKNGLVYTAKLIVIPPVIVIGAVACVAVEAAKHSYEFANAIRLEINRKDPTAATKKRYEAKQEQADDEEYGFVETFYGVREYRKAVKQVAGKMKDYALRSRALPAPAP